MGMNRFFRPLAVSGAALGMLVLAGCGDMAKSHDALKTQMTTQWNLTRIGIMYQLADQQYKVGDYDKCEDTLKDAFAARTPFAPIYILKAKIEIERGNLEDANANLNAAIRINASDPEPYYLLGVLYQRWQKPEVACDYYKQAWARKPDEERYLLATVEMEISMGKLDEAQSTLEGKLVYFEQSAALHIALARIATLKHEFATAAKDYRDATVLMPDDLSVQRCYAEAAFYAGEYATAAPLLEDLRTKCDDADRSNVVLMLGQTYLALRRNQDARDCFRAVIRDDPTNTLAYLNLGKACIETGELQTSIEAARRVLRTEPENVEAMILLALAQQKQNKWAEAEATLESAGKLAPSDTTVLCMRGVGAQEQGDKAAAAGFFAQAVAVNPKDAWAVELLGRVRPAAAQATEVDSPAAANTPETTKGENSLAAVKAAGTEVGAGAGAGAASASAAEAPSPGADSGNAP